MRSPLAARAWHHAETPGATAVACGKDKGGTKVGEIWKSLLGVVIGGCISAGAGAGTAYFAAKWTADYQRKQFLFERAQSFSEFIALQYLPRSGDVPPECQTRLEECRRLRESALQIYLFLPSAAQKELIKSYEPKAVEASASIPNDLPPEAQAFDHALMAVREWLTGEKQTDFRFISPCSIWKVEENLCRKP